MGFVIAAFELSLHLVTAPFDYTCQQPFSKVTWTTQLIYTAVLLFAWSDFHTWTSQLFSLSNRNRGYILRLMSDKMSSTTLKAARNFLATTQNVYTNNRKYRSRNWEVTAAHSSRHNTTLLDQIRLIALLINTPHGKLSCMRQRFASSAHQSSV